MLLLFSFTDTATTEIYTLSLHDALPISAERVLLQTGIENIIANRVADLVGVAFSDGFGGKNVTARHDETLNGLKGRSEEHTSELQSPYDLVCRLLLEKKKKKIKHRKQKI